LGLLQRNLKNMNFRHLYRAFSAVTGWFALILQLYLLIQIAIENGASPITGVMKFFDYFTILSNILVASVFTAHLVRSSHPLVRFLTQPKVKGGVAVYITITAIIYILILDQTWDPQGLALLANVLLHYVMPILYVLDWFLLTPKGQLTWKDALRWLLFPLGFAVWALFWGAIFGFYPYPFIDVGQLGYPAVFRNVCFVALGFLVISLIYVAIDYLLRQRKVDSQPGSLAE